MITQSNLDLKLFLGYNFSNSSIVTKAEENNQPRALSHVDMYLKKIVLEWIEVFQNMLPILPRRFTLIRWVRLLISIIEWTADDSFLKTQSPRRVAHLIIFFVQKSFFKYRNTSLIVPALKSVFSFRFGADTWRKKFYFASEIFYFALNTCFMLKQWLWNNDTLRKPDLFLSPVIVYFFY